MTLFQPMMRAGPTTPLLTAAPRTPLPGNLGLECSAVNRLAERPIAMSKSGK
jgi:hypothetical protein